eukprot:916719-Rhodomonas_salina.2
MENSTVDLSIVTQFEHSDKGIPWPPPLKLLFYLPTQEGCWATNLRTIAVGAMRSLVLALLVSQKPQGSARVVSAREER